MKKSEYDITYETSAYFTVRLELSDYQIKKIKKRIGRNKRLGGNNKKDNSLIEYLVKHSEFDYVAYDIDAENIEIKEVTNY